MAADKSKTAFEKFSVTLFIIALAVLLSVTVMSAFGFEKENTADVDTIVTETDDKIEANPDIGKYRADKIELVNYPETLKSLYEKNEEARDFVLSYHLEKDMKQFIDLSEYENSASVPLFMQWDKRWGYMEYAGELAATAACGPVCLSMVGYYLTGDEDVFSPDKIITFAAENGYAVEDSGTLWSLMSDGAQELGLISEELPLSENVIIEELENGRPVICIMGPGVFTQVGHFIVITSYSDGYFTVNDPNSCKRSEKQWKYEEFCDEILNLWSYCV